MASPSRPVLSICIPTRNRASYLRSALRGLTDPSPFPFPIEIVVSDNASDDETPRVVQERIAGGAPIRYFRQPRDIGAHPNMFAAYRRAEAEFAVYLADDDALLPESVAATIAWLHANPHVVALYAPFQNYDPVGEVVSSVTFHLPEEIEYTAADRLRLLDMLLAHDLVPEVPIFRTRAIGATLFRSATVYWAYPLLDRLLEAGAVKFSNRPFTR
ncbi:MAG: glycosyltransferase family 2 protein, partial [Proteobacteria bacterium]|nr:glycosyltransferase family 2 protein [Pseudomonadota bacterium]